MALVRGKDDPLSCEGFTIKSTLKNAKVNESKVTSFLSFSNSFYW